MWLGMGEDGGLVALKLLQLPPQARAQRTSRLRPASSQPDRLEELLAEVRLLRDLQHDNIVGIISSTVVAGRVVMVMEFVSGGSLQSLVEQFEALPIPSCKRYARDILRGLEFLHNHDVIHRDLKPGNVLLAIEGQCKLADFGAAAELSAAARQRQLGSPLYMAPEAAGGAVEKVSDIWSLGISLSQLVTGVLPWGDSLQDSTASKNRGVQGSDTNLIGWYRRLSKDASMVPEILDYDIGDVGCADFIRSMLIRDPSKRPSAALLLLDRFLA